MHSDENHWESIIFRGALIFLNFLGEPNHKLSVNKNIKHSSNTKKYFKIHDFTVSKKLKEKKWIFFGL